MPKKISLKTTKNNKTVTSYLQELSPDEQKEAKKLLKIFKEATGQKATMWGASIVGFGTYIYHRKNGDEGKFLSCGFSMRKSGPTLYILPGYSDYSEILKNLGPHKLGKSCLYLKNLDGIDLEVLKKLIITGRKDLKRTHQTDY